MKSHCCGVVAMLFLTTQTTKLKLRRILMEESAVYKNTTIIAIHDNTKQKATG